MCGNKHMQMILTVLQRHILPCLLVKSCYEGSTLPLQINLGGQLGDKIFCDFFASPRSVYDIQAMVLATNSLSFYHLKLSIKSLLLGAKSGSARVINGLSK